MYLRFCICLFFFSVFFYLFVGFFFFLIFDFFVLWFFQRCFSRVFLFLTHTMYGFTLSLVLAIRDYFVHVILLTYFQLHVLLLRLLRILYSVLHVLCSLRCLCALLHFLHWLLQHLSLYSLLSNFRLSNNLLCYASLL